MIKKIKWGKLVSGLLLVTTTALFVVYYDPPLPTYGATTQTANNNYDMVLGGEKIHIGGATNQFDPFVRINRWGMESGIELNLIGGGNIARFDSSTLAANGTVRVENNYFILEYVPVGVKPPFNEIGGLDYVITVKQNLGSNSITFTYNRQKANAYLQPPLSAEEIAQNVTRPDHVINSIAFYGDPEQVNNLVGGKEYRTGKIGHLYRMRVSDNAGNLTWADWGFGGGQSQITLSINQTWLTSAVFPIRIWPVGDTFGYTSVGASAATIENRVATHGDTYTGSVGTGVSASFYGNMASSPSNAQMAVYDNASPSNLISNATTDSVLVNSATYQWWTANFTTAPTFSAVEYYPSINCALSNIRFDDSGTNNHLYKNQTFGTWPSTITWTVADSKRQYSIYVTYTPGGGPPATGNATYNASSQSGNWVDPTNAYQPNNTYASRRPNYPAATFSPTANSGNFTNPTNAYADNGGYASITSNGQPTGSVYSGYGITLDASFVATLVRIRHDSWTAGKSTAYATANVSPVAVSANTGGFTTTGGTAPAVMADTSNTTYTTGVNNPGGVLTFSFTNNFNLPATASNITVRVVFLHRSATTNNANNGFAVLSIGNGAITYNGSAIQPNASTGAILVTEQGWTTNPATGSAWVYTDVNGAGTTNNLTAFGVGGTDFNPDVNFYEVKMWVTYNVVEADDQIVIQASPNGGSSWLTAQNTTLTTTETTTYYDITGLTTWNSTTLGNGNLQVRALAKTIGVSEEVRLDWIPVEVTGYFTGNLTHTFGDFNASPGSNITKVELGLEAYAATGEKVALEVSTNGGASWSANQTTPTLNVTDNDATGWYDFTAAAANWTTTLLNNTNFKVRLTYVNQGSSGNVTVDWIALRVTWSAGEEPPVVVVWVPRVILW